MARPKKAEADSRLNRIYVRLTNSDKNTIAARAEKAALSVSEYMRRMALDGEIVIPASKANFTQIKAFDRIGVNLNQITKKLNTTGQLQSHAHEATLKRINELLDELQGI